MVYLQGEGLISLLHKHSLLRTQSCFLQCDVIVQMSESSAGEVGDKFEAFVGESLRLNMSHQCLKKKKKRTKEENEGYKNKTVDNSRYLIIRIHQPVKMYTLTGLKMQICFLTVCGAYRYTPVHKATLRNVLFLTTA